MGKGLGVKVCCPGTKDKKLYSGFKLMGEVSRLESNKENEKKLKIEPPWYFPHPTPCTLHPAPYTLHLAPYTLHPATKA